jgi:UDP-glucose 4-epimerase
LQALDSDYINKHLIITGSQQIKIRELLTMIKEIFQNEIKVEYGNEEELHHYQITPYAFKPKIAKKIVPKTHYDLGQGLLDIVFDLDEKIQKEKNPLNISLRKR